MGNIAYEIERREITVTPTVDTQKLAQFQACERWYKHWKSIDRKLSTSIVQGISIFLSLFDADPELKAVFCPPKECYDPVANPDGSHGVPVPSMDELIRRGAVVALNFPMNANPGLAKIIGTFLKQDFQRAMLTRIPEMARHPEQTWRHMLFLCDEYHAFATVGEKDPTGDEKFFALSREAKCIPIIATQSISSLKSTLGPAWETLVSCFRTQVFLTLDDYTTARAASDLCGRELQLRESYSLSETGQDAGVNIMTGSATAQRASVGASKSYSEQMQPIFEPHAFAQLRNAQAIVLAYDGANPQPPQLCYLKPHYLDPNRSYFEQVERGEL